MRAILFLFIAAVREGDSGSSGSMLFRFIAVFGDSFSSCALATDSPSSLGSASEDVSDSDGSPVFGLRDLRVTCAVGVSDVNRRRDPLTGAFFWGTGVNSSSSSSSSSGLDGVGVTFPWSSDSEVSSNT